MKQRAMTLLVLLIVLVSFLTPSPALAANAVVGSGTPASCTETAFDTALAQVNGSGGTLTFNCGLAEHSLTLTTEKIINLVNVTINGNNRIILYGSTGVRHFFVGNGVTFTLQNIKLRNGDPLASGGALEINESTVVLSSVELSNNYSTTIGGAIYCYGTSASVTITNSLISNNSATTSGGGFYNDGCTVNITNSTFLSNTAASFGGGIDNVEGGNITMQDSLLQDNEAMDGSAMYNTVEATATLTNVDFYSNAGGYGGGIENSGTLVINDSLFRENSVTGSGGGLWNLNGAVTINRSTFRQNSAYEGAGINTYGSQLTVNYANLTDNISSGSGGGLYHGGGTAFLSNLTISGNQAVNGGGVYQSSDDNLTLTNATIANNSASSLGGGLYHYNRYAILTNVTMANNTAPTGSAIYEDSPMDITHPGVVQMVNSVILGSANNCDGNLFTSLGNNLSQGTCNSFTDVSDQLNYTGALNLGALTFNGGSYPMRTMRPLLGSPLINTGSNASCPATDQPGTARPQGAICDIGAYEFKETTKNGGLNLYTGASKIPTSWLATNFTLNDGKDTITKREGTASVKIIGQTGQTKILTQQIVLKGKKGDMFTFSFWIKATKFSPTGLCEAQVFFYNGTSLAGKRLIQCPAGTTYGWQQAKLSFGAPGDYTKLVIKLVFSKPLGTAWFDWVSLTR